MSTHAISVTVLGRGPLAELLVQRIARRTDLSLVQPQTSGPAPTTDCVIYLPTTAELEGGTATSRILDWLKRGYDVISSLPASALDSAELRAACRAGGTTYHGTGGLQSRLVSRVNRAFSTITRNIHMIELTEELELDEVPPHPWTTCADCGLEETEPQALQARVQTLAAYYDAGLHTLSEAVFHDAQTAAPITVTAIRPQSDALAPRGRTVEQASLKQIVVRRSLGDNVGYDSVWTQRPGSTTPLRYRLTTTSDDAVGHVTITFHAESDISPVDHLICGALLDAIRPVYESAAGILHHDLEINYLKLNECLVR